MDGRMDEHSENERGDDIKIVLINGLALKVICHRKVKQPSYILCTKQISPLIKSIDLVFGEFWYVRETQRINPGKKKSTRAQAVANNNNARMDMRESEQG